MTNYFTILIYLTMNSLRFITAIFLTFIIWSSGTGQVQLALTKDNDCCQYSNNGQNIGIEGESFGVALGDLDGDGDLDAVKVDAYNDIEVYENGGNASFTLMQNLGGDGWRYGVKIADVDLDIDMDIIVAGFGMSNGCEVYKNNGTGSFSLTQGSIASNLTVYKFDFADLNGDSYPDLFLPAYSGGNSQVWFNDGSGYFNDSYQSLAGQSCNDAALGDIDGDGDADAFVSCTNSSPSMVWMNNGTGIFTNSGQSLGTGNSYGVDMADLDNDGDLDAVCANWTVPSQVWVNDGNGVFTEGFVINNNNYGKSVKIMDHDYDHLPDIFLGSYGSPGLQVWHNTGSGNFELCYVNSGDVYAHDLDVGDMDGNLMPDVYLGNFSSDNGDQVFIKATPFIEAEIISICQGDSIYIGGGWQTVAGSYLDALNCDTIIQSTLTITIVDTSVTANGPTLTANATDALYQWLDCTTWLPVEGATSQSFTPEITGYYAVEVTQQNCADTSECYYVIATSLTGGIDFPELKIYPNPSGNAIYIETGKQDLTEVIKLSDLAGRIVAQFKPGHGKSTVLDVSGLKPGCYFVRVQYKDIIITSKVMVGW